MTDEREALSALIDREAVDPDVLARVLEDPLNRSLLVDFSRMRNRFASEEPESVGAPPVPGFESNWSRSMRTAWRVAAVFLLLAMGTAGGAWLERYRTRERPPEPDRIVLLEPAPPSGR